MKKIIDGKMYNTETAKKVGYYDNGAYESFSYFEETLYRKGTGEFFLYGSGDANSRYRKCSNGYQTGSEEIIPYTKEKARKWMEQNASTEEYIKVFGEPNE